VNAELSVKMYNQLTFYSHTLEKKPANLLLIPLNIYFGITISTHTQQSALASVLSISILLRAGEEKVMKF